MPLLSTIGAAAARAFGFLKALVTGGYEVDNSLRFNSGSSDFLNRTPASSGDKKTFTYSTWIKRSNFDSYMTVLFATTDTTQYYGSFIQFYDDNTFSISDFRGSYNAQLITSQVFRDPSAWYHIVVAIDTTQATASNRVKLYVNGSQVTTFGTATYPTQNFEFYFNANGNHNIARDFSADPGGGARNYFNGYMSEIYMIDGQALTPSSFGQTDPSVPSSGIWIPKAYTGSFGTNGFYLKFANSAALGTDSSGNGNNFTVNNLTSVDQSTDTPTNNFCTFNPVIATYSAPTLTEGNLVTTNNSADYDAAFGTIAVSKGKWYWELKKTDTAAAYNDGVFDVDANPFDVLNPMNVSTGYTGFYNTSGGQMRSNNATSGSYGTFANGDIMGIALDMDNKLMSIYKNGTIHVSNFTISTGCLNVVPTAIYYQTGSSQYNFGSPPFTISSGNADANGYGNFEYAVPAGYYALNTKNLAEYA
jgi:hypothetical protein